MIEKVIFGLDSFRHLVLIISLWTFIHTSSIQCESEGIFFSRLLKSCSIVLWLECWRWHSGYKPPPCNSSLLLVKSFRNLKIIGSLITSKIVFFFLISNTHSTADLLTVVSDRIDKAFNMLMELELQHFIHPRLLKVFGILVFFTNASLIKFLASFLAWSLYFSVENGFWWFSRNICKSTILFLAFPKVPFFLLFFSYNSLLSFVMIV